MGLVHFFQMFKNGGKRGVGAVKDANNKQNAPQIQDNVAEMHLHN